MVSFKNHENYNDPTAYFALRNVVRSEKRKQKAKKKWLSKRAFKKQIREGKF